MNPKSKERFISYLKKKGLNDEQIKEQLKYGSFKDDYDIRVSRFIPSKD